MIKIFREDAFYLFSSPWYHKALTAGDLLSPAFLGDCLYRIMVKHFTEKLKYTDLEHYVIIPAFDIRRGQVHLFKNCGLSTT